jgi:hypothetical protein
VTAVGIAADNIETKGAAVGADVSGAEGGAGGATGVGCDITTGCGAVWV